MKITFPECQFDLTIEEYLILLDRETSTQMKRPLPYPSSEEREIPEPPVFKFPPEDEEPEPEPKPNPEENETLPAIIQYAIRRFFEFQEKRLFIESELTEQSRQRIINCENTLEEAINGEDTLSVKCALEGLDEAWNQAERIVPLSGESPSPEQPKYKPGGIVNDQANAMPKSGEAMVKKEDLPPVPNKAKLKAKPKAKPKARPKRCKKVDVLFNGKWIAFDSVSAAAAQIGCKQNSISTVLKKGGTVHGYEVRYHNEELDNILAEIEASNRKPYEATPRP